MRRLSLALFCVFCSSSFAQLPAAPASSSEALERLASVASVVFAGEVVSIHGQETLYRVDQAVAGCIPGQFYTVRQWQKPAQLHVGQHMLMLLHAPTASGLSSPVAGIDGAIPVLPSRDISVQGPHTPDAAGTASPQADLRWLQAAVAKPVTYRPSNLIQPSPIPPTQIQPDPFQAGSLKPSASLTNDLATADNALNAAASSQDLPSLLTQLRAWMQPR